MRKLKSFYYYVLIALCISVVFSSCNEGAFEDREDWSEVVKLYVDAELGEYRPWGHPTDAEPLDGLKIKERKDADWEIIPMDGIDGFTYVEGNEYFIEVEKTHLANPPADASNISYTLIRIISVH